MYRKGAEVGAVVWCGIFPKTPSLETHGSPVTSSVWVTRCSLWRFGRRTRAWTRFFFPIWKNRPNALIIGLTSFEIVSSNHNVEMSGIDDGCMSHTWIWRSLKKPTWCCVFVYCNGCVFFPHRIGGLFCERSEEFFFPTWPPCVVFFRSCVQCFV